MKVLDWKESMMRAQAPYGGRLFQSAMVSGKNENFL